MRLIHPSAPMFMTSSAQSATRRDALDQILDQARWAPSGDNTQPWRFRVVSDDHVAVEGFDTRRWCLYDFDGHASHIAHGALLETLRIAATAKGLAAEWRLRPGCADSAPVYDVHFREQSGMPVDPLFAHIERRVVQRRPMKMTPLSPRQRDALAAAPGDGYRVQFFESFGQRFDIAQLLWHSAHVRLTCPEAYTVHRDVIEWGARFSTDRIPEQAVGVDPMTARLMQWVMKRWGRVEFFNRFLLGTILPRVQLDFVPALACAAHVLLRADQPPLGVEGHVRAGVAMQRLWLTAASLGLHLQPQMTPLIFRWYVRAGRVFSSVPELSTRALEVAREFEACAGASPDDSFAFFCRTGVSRTPHARSLRKSIAELMSADS